jgi:hypothetical protein
MDWFTEDPWAEPSLTALEDEEDEWYPGLWESSDEDEVWAVDDEVDVSTEDPYDGWGPVRPRRKRPSSRP